MYALLFNVVLETESKPTFFQIGIHLKVASFDSDSRSEDDLIDILSKPILSNVKKKDNSHAMKEGIVGRKNTR